MLQIIGGIKRCEKELGDGYTVEIANKNNAGDGYDTAVVVTKNNENATKSSVPELGQPTRKGASMANVGANVQIKVERTKRLVLIPSNHRGYKTESAARIAKWFDSEFAHITKKGDEPLLKWADTKKASDWLTNHASDVHAVGLSSKRIAKIINKFANYQNFEGKNSGFNSFKSSGVYNTSNICITSATFYH